MKTEVSNTNSISIFRCYNKKWPFDVLEGIAPDKIFVKSVQNFQFNGFEV